MSLIPYLTEAELRTLSESRALGRIIEGSREEWRAAERDVTLAAVHKDEYW